MWIVDDEGDMFNTDHFRSIHYSRSDNIMLVAGEDVLKDWKEFKLSSHLNKEERLTRYHDLIEKLTGDTTLRRIDGIYPHLKPRRKD